VYFKTELFDIAYSEREHSASLCHYAPLIRLQHMALYKWLIDEMTFDEYSPLIWKQSVMSTCIVIRCNWS